MIMAMIITTDSTIFYGTICLPAEIFSREAGGWYIYRYIPSSHIVLSAILCTTISESHNMYTDVMVSVSGGSSVYVYIISLSMSVPTSQMSPTVIPGFGTKSHNLPNYQLSQSYIYKLPSNTTPNKVLE